MFAASTYEEIERIERQVENMEIVVFLFARPTEEKILKEFEYIHYNSARYCSIYAIGYTDDFTKAEDRTYRKVDAMMQQDWYFSMKAFTEFKEKLQNRIHWDYSGETEILILQNNPGKRNILNFQNYVSVLSELCDDRKKDYISYLMTVNADPELFRRIPLCPTSYSWSGSAVPLYSKWADYLKGLLPLFSGIQFLQHQKVVNDEIEHLSKMIERAEIEDLLQG